VVNGTSSFAATTDDDGLQSYTEHEVLGTAGIYVTVDQSSYDSVSVRPTAWNVDAGRAGREVSARPALGLWNSDRAGREVLALLAFTDVERGPSRHGCASSARPRDIVWLSRAGQGKWRVLGAESVAGEGVGAAVAAVARASFQRCGKRWSS